MKRQFIQSKIWKIIGRCRYLTTANIYIYIYIYIYIEKAHELRLRKKNNIIKIKIINHFYSNKSLKEFNFKIK